MDDWHVAHGAQWMPAGNWRRPALLRRRRRLRRRHPGRSARRAQGAGLIDVATLGKIDVFGATPALLIERLYTGRFADLAMATRAMP